MSRNNQQQFQTRGQMEAAKDKPRRKLPDAFKMLIFICLGLPTICLGAYLTGFWEIKVVGGKMVSDGLDYFIKYFVVTSGSFGLVILWFSYYWLEGD